MVRTTTRALLLAAVAVVAWASPSTAQPQPLPDFEVTFPAGLACPGFDLVVEGTGGKVVSKEFTDEDGDVVRSLSAGTGSALTFTNATTGASLSFRSNGAVGQTLYHPDGSSTQTSTGHNVLILFPTDVPAGPSTTLYVGRVQYTVDGGGVFTLVSTSGNATDICAALSA